MGSNKQSNINHYLVVATGIALCMGPSALAFSCAGIFYTPVSTALGVGKGTFAVYMTVLCFTMFFALSFAGKILAAKDARAVLSTAVLLVGGGLFAMGFFNAVWQFYIAGAFIGFGESILLYLAVPTLINRWFKQRVGFFVGLCMAFTGVGGVLFNPLGDYLITTHGWQMGYRVFGILAIAIALPFTLFAIRSFPKDKGLLPYGDNGQDHLTAAPVVMGVSASKAFKSGPFFATAAFAGLVGFNSVIYQFLPSYASSLPLAATVVGLAGLLASAAMAGQALGKVGLGTIADKSIMGGMWTALICGAAGLVLLWFVPTSVAIVLIAGFLFGPFYACAVVQVPLMARSIFGVREYSQIYSRISMFSALMAAFGATIWGYLIDWTGFRILFILGLIVLACTALVGVYALGAGKKLEQTAE
ncbi:MAG: MFS transporter [Desulfobacterales bacterium]|nr:MFS transporter [Desulfobacterales bacterium]